MSESNAPEGMELTLRTVAMPSDTNAAGDIFGGWVLFQMDMAAGLRAEERANGRVVIAVANEVVFKEPIKVGDTLCIYTEVESVKRTSMVVRLETWVRRARSTRRDQVCEARFTMVAVDDEGRPRPVDAPAA